jgi:hypothetical protein
VQEISLILFFTKMVNNENGGKLPDVIAVPQVLANNKFSRAY